MSKMASNVRTLLLALLLLVGTAIAPASAQSPFSECPTRTATNASLLLPKDFEIILDDSKYEGPAHIAVFTPEGHCAGSTRWSGEAKTLTVWGTDDEAPAPSASDTVFTPGDRFYVHLFVPTTNTTYVPSNSEITLSFRSDQPHLTTSPQYIPDGIYALDHIRIRRATTNRQDD